MGRLDPVSSRYASADSPLTRLQASREAASAPIAELSTQVGVPWP